MEEKFKYLTKEEQSALLLFAQNKEVSMSLLQRNFLIGFPRAMRIVDNLCEKGFVQESTRSNKKKLLLSKKELIELFGKDYLKKEIDGINQAVLQEKYENERLEALSYLCNEHGKQNAKKAIKILEQLVEKNYFPALDSLGMVYFAGEIYGVKKNLSKAIQYFEEGHKHQSGYSTYRLAEIYYIGDGVKKDLKKALSYAKESVKLNYASGYRLLGVMYENGENVKKDLHKAFRYYFDGASHGDELCKTYLENVFCNKK